jgi:hypothetical protein
MTLSQLIGFGLVCFIAGWWIGSITARARMAGDDKDEWQAGYDACRDDLANYHVSSLRREGAL